MVPERRSFLFYSIDTTYLQEAASAISVGGRLQRIIAWICSCCDFASGGAILGCDFGVLTLHGAGLLDVTSINPEQRFTPLT
jgi:hypothetical protein